MSANLSPLQKLTQSIRTLANASPFEPGSPAPKTAVERALDTYAKNNPGKVDPAKMPSLPPPGSLPFNFSTCTVGFADNVEDAAELDLCSLKKTSSGGTAKSFAERAKSAAASAANVAAGAVSGCTALQMKPMDGFEGPFYSAMESAAIECAVVDAALTAYGIGTAVVGGEITLGSGGATAIATVPAMAVGVAAAGAGVAMAPLHAGKRDEARANQPMESRRVDAKPVEHKEDIPLKKNHPGQSHSYYGSEGEARSEARKMIGRAPVKFDENKLRSENGRWQYRAKPSDVGVRHIHLEKIDVDTGRVISNLHLHW